MGILQRWNRALELISDLFVLFALALRVPHPANPLPQRRYHLFARHDVEPLGGAPGDALAIGEDADLGVLGQLDDRAVELEEGDGGAVGDPLRDGPHRVVLDPGVADERADGPAGDADARPAATGLVPGDDGDGAELDLHVIGAVGAAQMDEGLLISALHAQARARVLGRPEKGHAAFFALLVAVDGR